jgi:hypothetical protein
MKTDKSIRSCPEYSRVLTTHSTTTTGLVLQLPQYACHAKPSRSRRPVLSQLISVTVTRSDRMVKFAYAPGTFSSACRLGYCRISHRPQSNCQHYSQFSLPIPVDHLWHKLEEGHQCPTSVLNAMLVPYPALRFPRYILE